MLIVFEIAPEINGCAAAIILIWLSVDKKRFPIFPQGLAQSNIDKCSSFICGAFSNVIDPQQYVFASSISFSLKPKCSSILKDGSSKFSDFNFKLFIQKSSPIINLLKIIK